MRIIGKSNEDRYIVEISRVEIEKVMNKYYGKLQESALKPASEFNLSDGYDFREDIQRACRSVEEASRVFDTARNTLLRFSQMVSELNAKGEMK